jgi:HAD superfamily hydrolase (TIGR01509 family)
MIAGTDEADSRIRNMLFPSGIRRGLAFMFDLDGVIVNSNPVHSACWREYLRGFGAAVPDDFDQRMYGRRNDEIVRLVFGDGLEDAEVLRRGAEKEALFRTRIGPVLDEHLVPGVGAFLDRHRDVPKAVATNGERANLQFVLNQGGLARYFQATLNGEQVSRPKPDPEIYLRTADLLAVPPRNCIVFEDSNAGVEAALAAGTRVVGLTTTHPELPGTHLTIRDFTDPDLEPWLFRQEPV